MGTFCQMNNIQRNLLWASIFATVEQNDVQIKCQLLIQNSKYLLFAYRQSQEFQHAIAKIPQNQSFIPPPFYPHDPFYPPTPPVPTSTTLISPPYLLLVIQLSHFPHLSYKLDYLDYQQHSVIRSNININQSISNIQYKLNGLQTTFSVTLNLNSAKCQIPFGTPWAHSLWYPLSTFPLVTLGLIPFGNPWAHSLRYPLGSFPSVTL